VKFLDLIEKIQTRNSLKITIAAADDLEIMKAVKKAESLGLCTFHFIGDQKKIADLAKKIDLSMQTIEITDEPNQIKACVKAVESVRSGESQILMKGLVTTAQLLKVVLDKESGLRTNRFLSHVAVFEIENYERLLLVTDAAINIQPSLEEKVQILQNSIDLAHKLELRFPKVAVLSAIETVNFKIQSTTDAAIITKMAERGQIKGANVDGPFALDNAISLQAANHKGVNSKVAGQADILLVPNLEVGNVLYKSLVYFGSASVGGIVQGAKAPIVLTSRADTSETKFNSIILALLSAQN